MKTLLLLCFACGVASSPLRRRRRVPSARFADGHPDMQGLWYKFSGPGFDPLFVGLLNGDVAPGQGPARGGRGPAPDTTRFLRPGVPVLPYLPAAAALKQDRNEHHMFDDPEAHCHIPGVPRGTEQPPYPFQIIQDEKYFTILYEYRPRCAHHPHRQ